MTDVSENFDYTSFVYVNPLKDLFGVKPSEHKFSELLTKLEQKLKQYFRVDSTSRTKSRPSEVAERACENVLHEMYGSNVVWRPDGMQLIDYISPRNVSGPFGFVVEIKTIPRGYNKKIVHGKVAQRLKMEDYARKFYEFQDSMIPVYLVLTEIEDGTKLTTVRGFHHVVKNIVWVPHLYFPMKFEVAYRESNLLARDNVRKRKRLEVLQSQRRMSETQDLVATKRKKKRPVITDDSD